ncbi:MAG: hypothetical protein HZA01_16655 [Nitrospinae bacterium]|nr:hypothetical protein [Nitrospinota bacterium]
MPVKAIVSILGTVAFVAGVFFITRPGADREKASGGLRETRPVLAAGQFSGKTAMAYQYAAEIPVVIDRQFCYCYCEKNFNHKSLLTCFVGDHGAECGICQDEVIRSYELRRSGASIEEIKKAIDAEFGANPAGHAG